MSKFSITNPKRNNRRVICDVCGFEYSVKDVTKVTDSYNRRYGLVVCKNCRDKANPQDRPFTVNEVILTNTSIVRPEQSPVYVTNENDDRLPGKPTQGLARIDPLEDVITLYWQPPGDQGSSLITGYVIKRADPQLATYTTIEDDTATSVCYYKDSTGVIEIEYSYTVAAINGFGTGPTSDPIYWPVIRVAWDDIEYIVDGDGNVIMGGDGYLLRSNHTEQGIV
jgi:hypothetical protein